MGFGLSGKTKDFKWIFRKYSVSEVMKFNINLYNTVEKYNLILLLIDNTYAVLFLVLRCCKSIEQTILCNIHHWRCPFFAACLWVTPSSKG